MPLAPFAALLNVPAGNSKLPQFHITNAVDIFLYNADSSTLIQSWINQVNPAGNAGQVTACVNDSWWGGDGANWNGENITSQYFFAITPTTQTGVAYQSPISTFAAVREYCTFYSLTACTDRSVQKPPTLIGSLRLCRRLHQLHPRPQLLPRRQEQL